MTVLDEGSVVAGSATAESAGEEAVDASVPRVRWTLGRPRWGSNGLLLALTAVTMGGLYAFGALLQFWYLTSPEAGSLFFPPAGLTVGVLLLTPRRTWPLWVAVVGVVELTVDLSHGQSFGMALGFAAANMAEPLVGATVVVAMVTRARSPRARTFGYLAGAVVIGPVVGATVATLTSTVLAGTAWLPTWGKWWLGDALGVLIVATPILAWSNHEEPRFDVSLPEIVLMSVLAGAVTVVPAAVWDRLVLYAVLPVLMFTTFRGGARALSVASLAVAFSADWLVVSGHVVEVGPGMSQEAQLAYIQVFLFIAVLTGLGLAVEVAERRRAERAKLRAERDTNRAELVAITAAAQERHWIAQETHDIVGHALNVMLLQAGAARRTVERAPAEARSLLESMEKVGREAFRDLDLALGLDSVPAPVAPTRGLYDIPGLIDAMRSAGLDVTLHFDVDDDLPVSRLVQWSTYRIVEDAMTNVAKHAPRSHTEVSVRLDGSDLQLAVTDDGRAPPGQAGRSPGRGLTGIKERTGRLGGRSEVGPLPGGGFAVVAWLPALRPV